jgi:hypothetical protein
MTTPKQHTRLFFLLPNDWSPRYDDSFFTFQVVGFAVYTKENPPPSSFCKGNDASDPLQSLASQTKSTLRDSGSLPAVYYHIIVYRGYQQCHLYRRYSQFYWLYQQILRSNVFQKSDDRLVFPPGRIVTTTNSCPFFVIWPSLLPWRTAAFAASREPDLAYQGEDGPANVLEELQQRRFEQLSKFLLDAVVLQQQKDDNGPGSISTLSDSAVAMFLELSPAGLEAPGV